MLKHVARGLSGSRLLIVGTYRDVEVDRSHALSGALAELRRVSAFGRIALRGLTADEVQRMMAAIAGREVPWSLSEAVYRQTEGNPLFVQEVLRDLVEEGHLSGEGLISDAAMSIPEGLRDVIGKRLTRLSQECNRVLSIAAVIGREFRLDVLQGVSEKSEEELFAALEEAQGAAVIEERPSTGAAVSFWFTHAFFRQTLYEEMFAPRRIRLHQQVGRALEGVHESRPEEHAAEMAEHFAHSSDTTGLQKALAYSEMAAGRSMAVYAYGEAARLLEQALQVQEVLAPDDRAKRCDLLLALGDALMPAGEPKRVYDTVLPEALALAEAIDDRVRLSHTCLMALEADPATGLTSSVPRREASKALRPDPYAVSAKSSSGRTFRSASPSTTGTLTSVSLPLEGVTSTWVMSWVAFSSWQVSATCTSYPFPGRSHPGRGAIAASRRTPASGPSRPRAPCIPQHRRHRPWGARPGVCPHGTALPQQPVLLQLGSSRAMEPVHQPEEVPGTDRKASPTLPRAGVLVVGRLVFFLQIAP